MSVSLSEVLEASDYRVTDNVDDAIWFLSKRAEIEELLEQAEELVDSEETA